MMIASVFITFCARQHRLPCTIAAARLHSSCGSSPSTASPSLRGQRSPRGPTTTYSASWNKGVLAALCHSIATSAAASAAAASASAAAAAAAACAASSATPSCAAPRQEKLLNSTVPHARCQYAKIGPKLIGTCNWPGFGENHSKLEYTLYIVREKHLII